VGFDYEPRPEVTRSGRLFQMRAAATGKAWSPTVDRVLVNSSPILFIFSSPSHVSVCRVFSVNIADVLVLPVLHGAKSYYCFAFVHNARLSGKVCLNFLADNIARICLIYVSVMYLSYFLFFCLPVFFFLN